MRALFRKAAGTPAAGMKVMWWVPGKTAGTFELRDTGVTDAEGLLDVDVTSATFGSHLRLAEGMVATYPVKMSSTVIDFGTLVLLDPVREGIAAVPAAVAPTAASTATTATATTTDATATEPATLVEVAIEDRLKSAGQQIESVKASLTTMKLTQVRVRWTETTAEGTSETEAQFVEQLEIPTEPATEPVARPVPSFHGLTPAAARRLAAEAGLRVALSPIFTKESGQHGRVLRQLPKPGVEDTTASVQLFIGRAMEG
ncbi:PASTA domain-containing protein [Myxococcus sp. RHSTA-1-4]|uniref:PASTA domain-containing protein n=1 Tax=Myxococcus sp. RHSTA-1-4 TaxID=2874601 RepID=UPI001CC175EB|nr:PASTA domain-containing protein [Myxococcus sp. RHSTA-1-4]MBZ4421731.1 hypothetical protein [Myxococcus sp. RHSTA-1-4]